MILSHLHSLTSFLHPLSSSTKNQFSPRNILLCEKHKQKLFSLQLTKSWSQEDGGQAPESWIPLLNKEGAGPPLSAHCVHWTGSMDAHFPPHAPSSSFCHCHLPAFCLFPWIHPLFMLVLQLSCAVQVSVTTLSNTRAWHFPAFPTVFPSILRTVLWGSLRITGVLGKSKK